MRKIIINKEKIIRIASPLFLPFQSLSSIFKLITKKYYKNKKS